MFTAPFVSACILHWTVFKPHCTVFKPKFYNLYQIPTIFIGIESLKYVSKSKYLGLASRTQNMMIVTWCVK